MKQHTRVLSMVMTTVLFTAIFFCNATFAAAQAHDLNDNIMKAAGEAFKYVWVIGTIVAVVVLAMYGMAWITASPQQKAVLKEKVSVYLIGAILLYGGASITVWIVSMLLGAFGGDMLPVPDK